MFGLSMHTAPRVTSYDEARRVFNTAKSGKSRGVIAGYDAYAVPGKENNPTISMRMKGDGDVAFRYHYTDVITWHPDGSYTYDDYESTSTCTFFNAFCPIGTHLTRTGTVLIVGDTGYPVAMGCTVRDGKPVDNPGRFKRACVNRKAAKRVLEPTRYAEYRDWYKIMKPLLGNSTIWADSVLRGLEDETHWPAIAGDRFGDGHPDKVRQAIYNEHYREVYENKYFESLPEQKAEGSSYDVIRCV